MMSNIYRIAIAVLMFIAPFSLYSQSIPEIEGKMDEIKLDETLIYGEDVTDNHDIAYNNALSELLSFANELRVEKGYDLIKISDLQPVVKELAYSKGKKHVVLVYLALSDMYALKSKSRAGIVLNSSLNQSSQNNTIENKVETSEQLSNDPPVSNDILDTLCGQDNWTEIKGFLSTYKKEGKIKETGSCASFADVPDDACSILIDEMYGILSILSPKRDVNRINYRTNQADSETNYPNCKVIVWYR